MYILNVSFVCFSTEFIDSFIWLAYMEIWWSFRWQIFWTKFASYSPSRKKQNVTHWYRYSSHIHFLPVYNCNQLYIHLTKNIPIYFIFTKDPCYIVDPSLGICWRHSWAPGQPIPCSSTSLRRNQALSLKLLENSKFQHTQDTISNLSMYIFACLV